jgi:hypothetical protein
MQILDKVVECGTVKIMLMTRKRGLYLAVGFTLGHLLIGVNPLSAQVDCKVVVDALNKVHSVPAHAYTTTKVGGKDVVIETIYAGGNVYTGIGGKWSSVPMPPEEKQSQDDKATCRYVKDELVNSEMTAVYATHDVSPKGVTDTQVWISKSKGLPLRVEMDINAGGGKDASLHTSSRYEYSNVKPPI